MREEKLLLEDLKDKIGASPAFIVTRYQSLKANMATDLRLAIRGSGGDLEVIKKRLLFKVDSLEVSSDLKEGHLAVVFAGSDVVKTAKAVVDFGKKFDGALTILSGNFEGKTISAEEWKALSELPSAEVLRSQLLATLEAPISQTLVVIETLLKSVVYCLENKTKV